MTGGKTGEAKTGRKQARQKARTEMEDVKNLIGVCLSQAHTFLKTDFLAELDKAARKEGFSVVVFNSSMDYYWAQNGSNITGCVYELIRYDRLAALLILAVEVLLLGNDRSRYVVTGGNIHLAQEGDHTPVSPAGIPLCFANSGKDHYEAVFRDEAEEWTYKADRNEDGYLGVWILL